MLKAIIFAAVLCAQCLALDVKFLGATVNCDGHESTFRYKLTVGGHETVTKFAIAYDAAIGGLLDAETGITGKTWTFIPALAANAVHEISMTFSRADLETGAHTSVAYVAAAGSRPSYGAVYGAPHLHPAAIPLVPVPNPSSIKLSADIFDFPIGTGTYGKTNAAFQRDPFYSYVENYAADVLPSSKIPGWKGCQQAACTVNQAEFAQWFTYVPTVNIPLRTEIELVRQGATNQYQYHNSEFFPIDTQGWGKEGQTHNYGFCMALHTEFSYQGNEIFQFTGDDDLIVYLNNKKALELGGIHGAMDGTINVQAKAGEVGLVVGNNYPFDLYFCERHTTQSNFKITTSLNLVSCPVTPDTCGVCHHSCFTSTGAPNWENDADHDGVADCEDVCPNDPLKKTSPGQCGCGRPENCIDEC